MSSTATLDRPVADLENLERLLHFSEVVAIPEQADDAMACARAEGLIRSAAAIGSIAVHETLNNPEESPAEKIGSLWGAITKAAEGDTIAKKVIARNATTDLIERAFKTGFIMTNQLETTDDGKIIQHGQSLDQISFNSLKFAAGDEQMRKRVEAETRNGARQEQAYQKGSLRKNYFVIISRAADDMTTQQMSDVGFFTDTMSCSLQLLTEKEDGSLELTAAFVSGKKTPESERHDAETIAKLGDALGVSLRELSATQLLDKPLLIPKDTLPNGPIDLIRLYDEAAGGTFFGEDRTGHDYNQYIAHCAEKQAEFANIAATITEELIARAASVNSQTDATGLLAKLSQEHLIPKALKDKSINPRVFGQKAATFIEEARAHQEQARIFQEMGLADKAGEAAAKALVAEDSAQKTAKSSSCPNGANGLAASQNDTEKESTTESNTGTIRCIAAAKSSKNPK